MIWGLGEFQRFSKNFKRFQSFYNHKGFQNYSSVYKTPRDFGISENFKDLKRFQEVRSDFSGLQS